MAMRTLIRNRAGAAAMEFALIGPIFLAMLIGLLELGMGIYMRAVLEGAMQQAGRNSSLQSAQASQTAIDNYVRNQVQAIMPAAQVTFTRTNYATFSDVGRAEDFTDLNANGRRDTGECFMDENGNGIWDADVGASGIGGADDVVAYSATVTYSSFLPVTAFGLSPLRSISAATMQRNQPFSSQVTRSPVQVCN